MKKIFSIALAATLLAAGCQKTEVVGTTTTGSKMSFSTEMKKITKADATATGLANLKEQGFNVWAYADYNIEKATNVNKTTGIFDGMENWYVNSTTANNSTSWSARKEFYWPGKGKKLHFFAVSGTSKGTGTTDNPSPVAYDVDIYPNFVDNKTTNVTIPAGSDITPPAMTITGFTVTSADDDLMVADFITQDQESKKATDATAGKVALNFRHTLSKVQFVFATPEIDKGPKVYVQQLTVTKLKDKGNLKVEPKETTSTPEVAATDSNEPIITEVTPAWTDQADSDPAKDFLVKSTTPLEFKDESNEVIPIDYLLDDKGKKVHDDNCGDILDPSKPSILATWLMIPQTLTADNQIEVIYLINNRQFKAIFPLVAKDSNQKTISEWAVNKFTKYTITLSPNLISFDANVSDDWETANNEIEHQN